MKRGGRAGLLEDCSSRHDRRSSIKISILVAGGADRDRPCAGCQGVRKAFGLPLFAAAVHTT